jgi:uncharacterized protein YecT (DUF1311 family)
MTTLAHRIIFIGFATLPYVAVAQATCIGAEEYYRFSCVRALFSCKESSWSSCHEAKFKTADTDLNEVYRSLLDAVPLGADVGPTRQDVVLVERAWLAWRDSHCQFEAISHSGRSEDSKELYYKACLYELTLERTKYLRGYYEMMKARP